MRVGLAYDLKEAILPNGAGPDDYLEEYDSRETIELICRALENGGHKVILLGGGHEFLQKITREQVDIVFNIAEGRGNYHSREAQVPAILEMLDIPYTGSDPQCLTICLDKPLTKQLLAKEVITPRWQVINDIEDISPKLWADFTFPVIIKPAYEGSSKGIRLTSVANNQQQMLAEASRLMGGYGQPVMIEEFINGAEVTVGIIGNYPPEIMGIMNILPRQKDSHFVYSLEVKRDYKNLVDYECPARLKSEVLERLKTASQKIFSLLGCRDFARIDFRVSLAGIPYFIEINPLPGLGSYSDLVIMADKMGISHQVLVNSVLGAALKRYPRCVLA